MTNQSMYSPITPKVAATQKRSKDGKRGGFYDERGTGATKTEDILNSILPPREFTEEKQQLLIQSVSSAPSKKSDIIQLQKELDRRLKVRRARETGICRIREELFSQCFDELIRQITINLSHRGLLLVRMRDEIRMVIQSYQTLYESALAYGIRKALQGEQRQKNKEGKIKELQKQCLQMEQEVEGFEKDIRKMIENDKILRGKEKEDHENGVNELKEVINFLRSDLEKKLSGEEKRERLREEARKARKKKKKDK